MKSILSIAGLSLAFGALLCEASVKRAACSSDNCYRALFPTQSPAALSSDVAFCATYTKTKHTATTGFPTRATSACGTATAKYSSACSCAPTTSTTTTTTTTSSTTTTSAYPCGPTNAAPSGNLVLDGDFECGNFGADWKVVPSAEGPVTFYKLTIGDNSESAFEWEQGSPPPDGQGPLILGQDVNGFIFGAQYRLNASIYVALTSGCTNPGDVLTILVIDPDNSANAASFSYNVCTAPSGVYVDVSYPFYGNHYMGQTETLQFIFAIKSIGYVRLDNISIVLV